MILIVVTLIQIFLLTYFWFLFIKHLKKLPKPKDSTNYNLMKYIIDIANIMIGAPLLVTFLYIEFVGTTKDLFLQSGFAFTIIAIIAILYHHHKSA